MRPKGGSRCAESWARLHWLRHLRRLGARGVRKLPLNLLDALRNLEKSKILRAALGGEVIDSFVKLKMIDEHTLNC